MPRFIIGIVLCCIWSVHLTAQPLSFNAYTPADGLTDARVQKIFQDSRGVLYFLTRDGFCSFDGQRFQPYTQYRDQAVSIVYDIVEEPDGSLFIAALSGLYRLRQQVLTKDTTLSNQVREPGHLVAAGPQKWLLIANGGTYLYSNRKLQPLRITEKNKPAQLLRLDQAVCTGNLIVGIQNNAGSALVIYNRENNQLYTPAGCDAPLSLQQYGNNLFVQTESGWFSLLLPAESGRPVTMQPLGFANGKKVSHFYSDPDGNTWIFGDRLTATYIRKSSQEAITYSSTDGFPANINNVFCDREKNYWFMVEGKGVYKLVQSNIRPFTIAGMENGQVQSISSGITGQVCIRSNQSLYIWQNGRLVQKKISPRPGLIQVVYLQNKWYAVYGNGLLETEDGRSIRFASFPEGTKQVSSRIAVDQKGRLLLTGDFLSVIANDQLIASTPLPYFTDNIAIDDNNQYWCFSRNGMITAYALSGTTLQKILSYADATYSTRFALHWNKDSFCIGTRNHGIVWIKANAGNYQKLKTVTNSDGLSNLFITSLLRLSERDLLAASVTGLDRVHQSPESIYAEQLFSRTGMFTGVPAITRLNDTTLLALTDRGELYAYSPELYSGTPVDPSLFFHSILVNGTPVDPAVDITFPYNRNNFRFIVSAPGFIDEKNIRFQFLLNGTPLSSGPSTRTGEAEFSNLSPGHYTLTITALFPGNDTVRKTIQYSFRINKPFWKTAGFIGALTAFILLIIYGLFRIQLRRKLQRQQIELEKEKAIASERSRIASDMHDDLGAGISTIKYLSQAAPFISPDVQKENNLKIAAQADDLVDKMNDIIWAMNEKNDTLDNLVFYTKAWVSNYLQPFDRKSVISIPASVPSQIIRGEKRQHIFLCIKEAVHNCIKHSGADTIWLTITLADHGLQIEIKDNGRGFDSEKQISGNGLSNMRKRMKAIQGNVSIKTNPGTAILFTIPL
ncbi:MAG: ATP-binding protein [Bacteroidetes bacterium]|nr:ATP-binding protein [Bacteroidota bacterium]